jgi:serine/threonine-protein kinase
MNTARNDDASPSLTGIFAPGTIFGAYTIVRAIHRGGMGMVYEARHRELRKRVALKTLHASIATDPKMGARFLREGRAASRLRHPHVVDVSDFGVQDGVAFLVMEYLEGENLAERLARDGALPPADIAELMLPVCAAVAAIHREGIVHRDLKPENIFLSRTHFGAVQPKVVDFGVSKMAEEAGLLTTGSNLLGTPCYMSPEQAEGRGEADARSDQYSLGVILYECATGRRAFEGAALFAILWAIVAGNVEPPRRARPELPEAFEAMVLRAMRVDAAARYPSIDALGRALAAFAAPPVRALWEPVFDGADGRGSAPTSLEGVTRLALAETHARSGPKLRAMRAVSAAWLRRPAVRRAVGAAALAGALALAALTSAGRRVGALPASVAATHAAVVPATRAVEAGPTVAVAPTVTVARVDDAPDAAARPAPPAAIPTVARRPATAPVAAAGGGVSRARPVARRAVLPVAVPAPVAAVAPVAPVAAPVAPPRRVLGANGAPIDE